MLSSKQDLLNTVLKHLAIEWRSSLDHIINHSVEIEEELRN